MRFLLTDAGSKEVLKKSSETQGSSEFVRIIL